MDMLYRYYGYTSEQTNEYCDGWTAHPVLRTTAKRVFARENGHTISLDRIKLERDGYATRQRWGSGETAYYTEAGMRAEGGDPATARLEE